MSDIRIEKLKEAIPDIDIDGSITNYTGTEDFYLVLLEDYAQADHLKKLEEALESKDYETYRLHAHSLKGTSRSVGLMFIAKLCEDLQLACDRQDFYYIERTHESSIAFIRSTIDNINSCLKC
ncbi:MAG: Hpt domain-containing protein [Pseudobutyrivibrio sp.]|nr:Hpt domain-containing protein [Pseudobutyrivibrio sp.]